MYNGPQNYTNSSRRVLGFTGSGPENVGSGPENVGSFSVPTQPADPLEQPVGDENSRNNVGSVGSEHILSTLFTPLDFEKEEEKEGPGVLVTRSQLFLFSSRRTTSGWTAAATCTSAR